MRDFREGHVIGAEEGLVAAPHEDCKLSEMRAGALNPLSRDVRQPAPFTLELVSVPVKVQASDIRRSEHFLLGLSPPSEDISEDSLEGLGTFSLLDI